MLLGILGSYLLGNMLAGKEAKASQGVIKASDGTKIGRHGIFNHATSFE